jgi:phosphatidylglycerophosphate synthase
MAAEKLGKYKTAVQDAALFILFLATDLPDMMGVMGAWIGIALFALATVLTIWSGVAYVVKNKQVIKED